MSIWVLDAEWDVSEGEDIVLDAKKLHCVVFKELDKPGFIEFSAMQSPEDVGFEELYYWFRQNHDSIYIGHNILTADLEVFRRLLQIPFSVGPDTIAGVPCTFIDTFTMSKRLNPDRKPVMFRGKSQGIHGLKAWARRAGSKKIEVEDWTSQPLEVYLERCRGDVMDNEAAYHLMIEEAGERQ